MPANVNGGWVGKRVRPSFVPFGTVSVPEIDADSLIPPIGPSTDGGLFTVSWHRGAPIDGTPVVLPAGTLTEPGGLAVGKRGQLYISNHGRQAGVGEVLRISLG